MTSAICTLFEGDHHYGVGALANSLYTQGFRGTIYAGYRGPLPLWTAGAKKLDGFTEFSPADGLTLRFIPLTTGIHFAMHKPDFILEVWEQHCPKTEALFYFDPDITVKCRWTFFEEWVEAGVAMCADVNPSMSANHPIRHAWKKSSMSRGIEFRRELDTYFNSGFVGVASKNKSFLVLWKTLVKKMVESVKVLDVMKFGERTEPFNCLDQDMFNITVMASETPISSMGQDGMDFQFGGGGYVMSHSIGSPKPWNKPFLLTVICRAASPSRTDREYFKHVEFPIRLYPLVVLRFKRFRLLAASFLGRFMRNI